MTIKNWDALDPGLCASRQPTQGWVTRLQQLSDSLLLCPTDIATRCELAALLEQLDQHEEVLVNWNTVLTSDPNNLNGTGGRGRPAVDSRWASPSDYPHNTPGTQDVWCGLEQLETGIWGGMSRAHVKSQLNMQRPVRSMGSCQDTPTS